VKKIYSTTLEFFLNLEFHCFEMLEKAGRGLLAQGRMLKSRWSMGS
jgi:hypothetical protein